MSGADAFFDTNVLLYLISPPSAKADRAEALLADGGTISTQVLNEFVAVALRKSSLKLSAIRDVLTTVRAVCKVVPLDVLSHDLALDLVDRYRFSVYDALIVATAQLAKCTLLYTEDLQHGQTIDRLTIQNPFTAP